MTARQVVEPLDINGEALLEARKTRHSSKKRARRVTGVVLGSNGKLYVGRDLKRRIRAMIHKFSALTDVERATLSGLMSYAVGFDPDFKNSLIAKYGVIAAAGICRRLVSLAQRISGWLANRLLMHTLANCNRPKTRLSIFLPLFAFGQTRSPLGQAADCYAIAPYAGNHRRQSVGAP